MLKLFKIHKGETKNTVSCTKTCMSHYLVKWLEKYQQYVI